MPCYSPLKGYVSRESGGLTFKKAEGAGPMEVACGSCLGCRLDRARMWSMRIMHESTLYDSANGNSFITLTYRNMDNCDIEQRYREQHIPSSWSLDKTHFPKFMKRLRKHFDGLRIRFFHCGEYGNFCRHGMEVPQCPVGCKVGRPHYHAILFNCTFDDPVAFGRSDSGEILYTSPTLEKVWGFGNVQVGTVTPESAGYVARYCLNKVTGQGKDEHYVSVDEHGEIHQVEQESCTMSRGVRCNRCKTEGKIEGCTDCTGGIGKAWFDKYSGDVFPSDETPMPGAGVMKGVPRYYEDLFTDEKMLEEVKRKRQEFHDAHLDEYTPERLMAKYKVKKAQTKILKREI